MRDEDGPSHIEQICGQVWRATLPAWQYRFFGGGLSSQARPYCMKRIPALQALSREHHAALVLAKACIRAAELDAATAIADQCASVRHAFVAELTPHFDFEEQNLLPVLLAAGETELVARTLKEHEAMRAMVRTINDHVEAAALAEFGRLLSDHVRFEERELFPRYEMLADK